MFRENTTTDSWQDESNKESEKKLQDTWNILMYCDNQESYFKILLDLDSIFPLVCNEFGGCK